ncbi:MAG: PAS and helix-turn-helix domain-containing protein [Legionellales bacterium]
MYIESSMLPGYFSVVNLDNNYIDANDRRVKLLGFERLECLLGKHYSELPCKAALQANDYVRHNQQVYHTGKSLKCLTYTCHAKDAWGLFIGERKTVFDANKNIVGVCSYAIDITHSKLIDIAPFLMETQHGKTIFRKKQFCYLIQNETDDNILSKRQHECLFLLLKGKTAKEIGKQLDLSARTVESYIDQIKLKFNVYTKSELIDYAISHGYINILPESLISIQ